MTVLDNLRIAAAIARGRLAVLGRAVAPLRSPQTLAEAEATARAVPDRAAIATAWRPCCRRACASCSTSPWRWPHGRALLLLDEPTSGISVEEKFGIMDVVMAALQEPAITVLFVEHDMEIVERYADRVLAFYDGTVIADGPPARMLSRPRVQT